MSIDESEEGDGVEGSRGSRTMQIQKNRESLRIHMENVIVVSSSMQNC